MTLRTWFLGVAISLSLATAAQEAPAPQAIRHGYAQCADGKNPPPVLVFEHPCRVKPIGELKCGEILDILSREGPWLKIRRTDGLEGYLGFFSASLSPKKFVPVDLPAPSGPYRPDCSAFVTVRPGSHPPAPVYTPDPEYSDEGRKSKINGTVRLEITVGVDGFTRDITVVKPLGQGLDEKAVEAVQQWRFDPATEDGQAVSKRITVEVSFRTYD